jgi:hypothetical protein
MSRRITVVNKYSLFNHRSLIWVMVKGRKLRMIFQLEKEAKKSGGDKYVSLEDETFVIYVPQSISRKDGEVKKELTIFIG